MKFVIHLPSALAGAALLSLVAVAVGAFQGGSVPTPLAAALAPVHVTIDGPIRVLGVPRPSEMVQIAQGTPLVVPAGKVFVLTALGVSDSVGGDADVRFFIDGLAQTATTVGGGTTQQTPTPETLAVPLGLTAIEGQALTVSSNLGAGRAWGYLAAP